MYNGKDLLCKTEKGHRECVPGSERYVRTKNGVLMLKCKCAESRDHVSLKSSLLGKLNSPSERAGGDLARWLAQNVQNQQRANKKFYSDMCFERYSRCWNRIISIKRCILSG